MAKVVLWGVIFKIGMVLTPIQTMDSSCAVQIFFLNPCFLPISCIQLLFFAMGHSNFVEEFYKPCFLNTPPPPPPKKKEKSRVKSGDHRGYLVLLCRHKTLSLKG